MLKVHQQITNNITSSTNIKYQVTDNDIFFMSNGIRKRKLYYNLKYTQQQNKWIAQIKLALQQQQNKIEVKDKQTLLRYYYSADLKIDKCIAKLHKYYQWFSNEEIQSISNQTKELYQKDLIYSYGLAKDGRPFIVMNAGKIDMDKYKPMSYYQSMNYINNKVIKQKFVPGYIETYHYILDLQQKLLTLPMSSLKEIIDIISNAYSMRMETLIIVNCTFSTKLLYSTVSGFISEQTQRKIRLFTKKDVLNGDILQFIDDQVLQRKYGGHHRNIDHRNMVIDEQTELNKTLHDQNSDFFTIYDNDQYYHYHQQPGCCNSEINCTIY